MKKFGVRIVETLSRTVIIKADTFDEAIMKVNDAYQSSEVILDADDFEDVEFIASSTFGKQPISEDNQSVSLFTKLEV